MGSVVFGSVVGCVLGSAVSTLFEDVPDAGLLIGCTFGGCSGIVFEEMVHANAHQEMHDGE